MQWLSRPPVKFAKVGDKLSQMDSQGWFFTKKEVSSVVSGVGAKAAKFLFGHVYSQKSEGKTNISRCWFHVIKTYFGPPDEANPSCEATLKPNHKTRVLKCQFKENNFFWSAP